MIDEFAIHNFRCFERLHIPKCGRVNVLVGDNGSGKTALLEALFLALSSSVEVSLRLRAQRGLSGNITGSIRSIEESIWREYFYNLDWDRPIDIALRGRGFLTRSLRVSRGRADLFVPLNDAGGSAPIARVPLTFQWTNYLNQVFEASPRVQREALEVPDTGEDIPDSFLFAANQTVGATEVAARYSELSRSGRDVEFVDAIRKEFDWIQDFSIEVSAGAPVLHVAVRDVPHKLPINSISGGINRIIAIMLTLAIRPGTVVIVDEMENGIFYKHKSALWRSLIHLCRKNNSQMFLTTHDEEWLAALVDVGGDLDDIVLWRLVRTKRGRVLRQIPGRALKAGLVAGEVR